MKFTRVSGNKNNKKQYYYILHSIYIIFNAIVQLCLPPNAYMDAAKLDCCSINSIISLWIRSVGVSFSLLSSGEYECPG